VRSFRAADARQIVCGYDVVIIAERPEHLLRNGFIVIDDEDSGLHFANSLQPKTASIKEVIAMVVPTSKRELSDYS
jgi:hypothetical protein